MRFRKLETTLNTIMATAVLHNICIMFRDNAPPQLERHEEIQYKLAVDEQRTIQPQYDRSNQQRTSQKLFRKFLLTDCR